MRSSIALADKLSGGTSVGSTRKISKISVEIDEIYGTGEILCSSPYALT